jgi:hypothetical protein
LRTVGFKPSTSRLCFLQTNQRTVISTEAVHSLIVNGELEKSASPHHRSPNRLQTHHQMSTKTTRSTRSYPRFCDQKLTSPAPNEQKKQPGKPERTRNNQKLTTIHHNSPQKPKTRFIHSRVVRPQLLTFVAPGTRRSHLNISQPYFTTVGSHPSAPAR